MRPGRGRVSVALCRGHRAGMQDRVVQYLSDDLLAMNGVRKRGVLLRIETDGVDNYNALKCVYICFITNIFLYAT